MYESKYNWEFIFLGANIDAAKEADSIGINKDDAYNYMACKDGVEKMYNFVCEKVSEKRKRYVSK